jgi:hypothetical protein
MRGQPWIPPNPPANCLCESLPGELCEVKVKSEIGAQSPGYRSSPILLGAGRETSQIEAQ